MAPLFSLSQGLHQKKCGRNKIVKVKRKTSKIGEDLAIYAFSSFEDFCSFCSFLHTSKIQKLESLAKQFTLYTYQTNYYLLINQINLDYPGLRYFYSTISEFGKFVNTPSLFKNKLLEYGTLVMKHNAIKTCIKHFCKIEK